METPPVQRVFGLGGCGGRVADAVARATAGHLPATVVDCDFASLGSLKACQPFFLGQNSSRFSGGQGSGGDAAAVRMAAEEQSGALSALLDGVSLASLWSGTLNRTTGESFALHTDRPILVYRPYAQE